MNGELHDPRSVLGFHEVRKRNRHRLWIVRVLEPEAESVSLVWQGEPESQAREMKRIHPGGLYELRMPPRPALKPYRLFVYYPDGRIVERHDAYYFSPQLSDYDLHLFNEGKHRRIYEKLGAHPQDIEGVSGTLFAVWAPNAGRVSVVGDFNLWDGRKNPMQIHGTSGVWELFVPGTGQGDLYKFEIKTRRNELLLKCDPFGFSMEERPATSSVVSELHEFEWTDQEWMDERVRRDPLKKPINIYEVHPGSWRRVPEENDRFLSYTELAERLVPYVREMGYTHVELLPPAEHPLDRSWGYQITGYYAPTARYGQPRDMMRFINCCHEQGIGVILDWVPGHFPKDGHGLARFDGSALFEHEDPKQGEHREWGTLIFNYARNEVRNFLIANALFWFEKYHIDGIRVDAVASMLYLDYDREEGEWVPNVYGGRENLDAADFLRELHELLFQQYPGILSIAEESTAWPGVTSPAYSGGLGFNLKWNMGWMNDTLRYMGKDPVHRKYEHHLITFSMTYAFSENYVLSLSHDEVVHGKRSLLAKMPGDEWQKRAGLRLYLSFQLGHPGKKLLFMGGEFGQWNEWDESQSLDWHLLEHEAHRQIQQCCRDLNHLYLQSPALYTNDCDWSGFQWIDLHDHDHSILSFIRRGEPDAAGPPLIFVFNFTPVPRGDYRVGFPEAGNYRIKLNTDDPRYGGSGFSKQEFIIATEVSWQGQPGLGLLDLPPLGGLILEKTN